MTRYTAWLCCLLASLGLVNWTAAQPPPDPTPSSDASMTLPLGPMSMRPADVDPGHGPAPMPTVEAGGSGLTFDAGLYLLHPYFSGNAAYFTKFSSTTVTNGPNADTSTTSDAGRKDFDYGMAVSPWLSVGYGWDDGVTVRARWWDYENDANTAVLNADNSGATVVSSATTQGFTLHSPGPVLLANLGPDLLSFHSDLSLDVVDAEIARELRFQQWTVEVAGGARYVHLSEHYLSTLTNSGTIAQGATLTDNAELFSRHHFDGAGPTAALAVRWHCGESGLWLYGNARGSLVFGSNEQDAAYAAQVTRVGNTTTSTHEASRSAGDSRSDLLPIVEMELGAEYRLDMGRVHPYIRAGLVGQTWFNAGNASSLGTDLGLLGVAATAGMDF